MRRGNHRLSTRAWLVLATCLPGCGDLAGGDDLGDGTTTVSSGGASGNPAATGSGAKSTTSGAGQGSGGGGSTYPPGPPGCGLDAAAFCDTFDAPAGKQSRAGELDPARWSAARFCNIGGPTVDDEAVAIGRATVEGCRPDVSSPVSVDHDTLICNGNDRIQSSHLLVATAAQNYGQNSYRVRQPFDFAGRTGTIVFDAEGYNVGLHGWISVEITEEPTPAPSFTFAQNYENGSIPRNGLEIQLYHLCGGENVGVSDIILYDQFQQTALFSNGETCVPAARGALNHFEVRVSQSRVEVFATPASNDGLTFGEPVLIGAADFALPFSRGYVHFTTHNHATLKYSNETMDAWVARWDNVGFDGPAIVGRFREYEALDSLTPTASGKTNVGYRIADVSNGPSGAIVIRGVDPTGATRARIALQNWSFHEAGSAPPHDFVLHYRMNGGAWHQRPLDEQELQMMVDLPNAGTRSVMLDVDVAELVPGDNRLELTTEGAPQQWPPVALNVDLILETP